MRLLYLHIWVMGTESILCLFLNHLLVSYLFIYFVPNYVICLVHACNFCYPSSTNHSTFNVSVQPRPMVPKKDISVYGYGSVAWKDRMEEWKKKQNDKLQVVKHEGDGGCGNVGGKEDDPDLPM